MNIDTIYQDFTTKLLPKIQEGLVITKEYFGDLFGRYVKYLIVTDSIYMVVGFTMLVLGIVGTGYVMRKIRNQSRTDIWEMGLLFTGIFILTGGISFFVNLNNLIKDVYIPEVRIIQEIQNYNK